MIVSKTFTTTRSMVEYMNTNSISKDQVVQIMNSDKQFFLLYEK